MGTVFQLLKRLGAKSHMVMLNVNQRCVQGSSQMVAACYLNICGPGLKGFKEALGVLCADAVQRPIPKEKARE